MAHPTISRTCVCGRTTDVVVLVDQNGVPYPTGGSGAPIIPDYGDHPPLILSPGAGATPLVMTQPDPVGAPYNWVINWAGTQVGDQLLAADGTTVLYEPTEANDLVINGAEVGQTTAVSGIRTTGGGTNGLAPTVALGLSSTQPPNTWGINTSGEIEGYVGPTVDRPPHQDGRQYYDTDLGEPIWSRGGVWRNILGVAQLSNVTLVYDNDFIVINAATPAGLGNEWEQYGPGPGNAGFGTRNPSQLQVDPAGRGGAGVLRITAEDDPANPGTIISGGCKLVGTGSNFALGPGSRWEVTCRADADPASITSMVALLWPDSGLWPDDGENNLAETFNNRPTRTPVESYVHWAEPAGVGQQLQYDHTGVAATAWHVYTLDWLADNTLHINVDGGTPVDLLNNYLFTSVLPTVSPPAPKELALQFDAWAATGPAAPMVFEIDRVRVWTLA